MARPLKEGLEYFPLDCDIDQDDKITLIEAQHGLIGFGIAIKLLMKIYNNSYFYEWTEKEQLLFSKRVNVDINHINEIINDLVKWGFFNKKLFETERILTSCGIQKRYLTAVGRRQRVQILKKYLLLDDETINVYKNLVIVDINIDSEVINDNIGTQSKVKESKVNKTKEKEKEIETEEQKPLFFPTPIHELIFNQFREITYGMWFKDSVIEEKGDLIIITVKQFLTKRTIENGYAKVLGTLTGKNITVKSIEKGED
ncbi:DUF4373 domain-containing protein [Clostridium saccharoperbutylacetonicum]|uniref:DUF4373 domain-containing protein n=1 Tax=Clostridium saccharoperbutylacetonicum TaxID=36745 RepID=UPI0009838ED0|nr:DUF4373 domain-containing protein [Clostridium saccharoperbutylacetonicum]AQR95528.1 hypothetical protein CLSAP_28440 [Clostridium saccharoperbutylacetonicum]NSB31388.1 hypothetical protein [Clostridium saccharoperbutylacetonicum]